MGGIRIEINNGAITFADEGLLDGIVVSCHSESGWLHFAKGGHVFWSGTFLGALEPVGTLDYTWGLVQECGPVVVINHNLGVPDMWTRAGPRPLPAAGELARLRFSSPMQARAIAPPDCLLQSDDGGQSFHEAAARAREFKTPNEWLGGDPNVRATVDDATMERLLIAYAHRAVASEAGAEVGGLRLRDGTWVWQAEGAWNSIGRGTEYMQYLSIRQPDGTVFDTRVDGKCKLLPWGNRLLADCGYGSELQVVYPLGGSHIPKPPVPSYHERIFVDPAGRYLVADAGPENGVEDKEDSQRRLLQFDGTQWHVYEHIYGSPGAISEKWLLLCGRSC